MRHVLEDFMATCSSIELLIRDGSLGISSTHNGEYGGVGSTNEDEPGEDKVQGAR
jgi:hypothetical protein